MLKYILDLHFFLLEAFFVIIDIFSLIERGLEESKVDSFLDDVVVRGETWGAGLKDRMTGSHIFVCAHGSRDVRCGVCGPALIEKLNEEIELRGLKNQISVLACSHVGGHKYAGNVIIYSPGPDGNIMGHW